MNDAVVNIGKYLCFRYQGQSVSGKTEIWRVWNRQKNIVLGDIEWSGAWRQYAFFVTFNTYFEEDCLRIIADFVENQTRLHKINKKMKR
jgi:hypothetical protein